MAFLLTGSVLGDIVGILLSLLIVLLTIYKWNYTYWKRKNLPYIEPSIPFGNLENPFSKSKIAIGELMVNLYNEGKSHGWKHFGIFLMKNPLYFVTDLNYVRNIMSKDFSYFVDRGIYVNEKGDPLSAHLFAIGGNKWKNLRRKLTPTFTSGKMKMMFKTIADCGIILDQVLQEQIKDHEPVDIKNILGNFTTDVIGSCAFGLECQSFNDNNSPFRMYGKKVFEGSPMRNLKGSVVNAFPTIAKALNFTQIPRDITDFFHKIVKDTVRYREEKKVVRKDFLQLLLELKSDSDEYKGDGNTLTLNEIAAQCFVFFIAGFETSSTTMTFSLYEMAINQEVQDKARKEVNEVLKNHNGEITYDSINDMKYMGQVINEALRKYPPVPFVTRVCMKDYKVPDSDLVLEKGIRVIIPIKGIHMDPDNFPEPEKFDPERYSDENKHKIKHYSHLPFGEGNRICIGERFGIMQTKVGLTVLLRRYKFTLSGKTKTPLKMNKNSFISAAEGEIWLNCERI